MLKTDKSPSSDGMPLHRILDFLINVDAQQVGLASIKEVHLERLFGIFTNNEVVCIAFHQFGTSILHLNGAATRHLEILNTVHLI